MADVKISALPAVVTAAGTDVFPVVQGGATKKETNAQLATYLQTLTWPVASGGTGLTSYAIGDLIYASGATTLAKLADVATGNALIAGGIGVAPSWGKVGLTTHVSGILPLANGGSGADLSATGGANQIVRQNSAGGVFTVSVLAAADIPNLDASKITTGALALARGGTHADLSATGGAGQYLKQAGAGADVTVGTIPATDLIYSGLTTGQPLRATGATSVAFGALDLNNTNATTNALLVARGGTGIASYAIGDIIYADGATSLAKLADVATGNALISGGITTAPSWGKIGLTTHVSGILPSANGGTGVNNAGTITNASNTTITGGGTIALGGFTATIPATLTAAGLAIANVFTAAQATTITDAATNATTTLLTLDHESSGTPAASFGTRMAWNLQSSTTPAQLAAVMDVVWSTATHASRSSGIVFSTVVSAVTTELLRIGGGTRANVVIDTTGRVGIGDTPGAQLQVAASGNNNSLGVRGSSSGLSVPVFSLIHQNATTSAQLAKFDIVSPNSVGLTIKAAASHTVNLFAATDSADVVLAQINQIGATLIRPKDAATNAATTVLTVGHASSGTPAAGYGSQVLYTLQDSTTADVSAADETLTWVVATHSSTTAKRVRSIWDTAARITITEQASGSAAMIGFLGAAAVVRQTGGENLTNNVTSGGVDGTIANYTDLTIYANDAAAIRNDIYQLARALKQDHDALRLYGFLT